MRENTRDLLAKLDADVCRLLQLLSSGLYGRDSMESETVMGAAAAGWKDCSFFFFMETCIESLNAQGRHRTAEAYASALNSFVRFREGKDIAFSDMDSSLLQDYEAYLHRGGVKPNSSSFYMRILRAVYNKGAAKGLAPRNHPFGQVYTGVAKTAKRAIPVSAIRQIKEMDLSGNAASDYARDMFLFSFYTRGMSFVDMAHLLKTDLHRGILTYSRKKTGRQLHIRWEQCMQDIIDKYDNPQSPYLLPIVDWRSGTDVRRQYIYAAHSINRCLKKIGEALHLPIPLTMYVSRHTWASAARSRNVPLSVISEGMGHDSEATTRIYLASLDTAAIDDANSLILELL